VAQLIGGYRESLAQLGRRVAELHLALASNTTDPAFVPDAYSALDRRSKYQSLRMLGSKVLRLLRERLPTLSSHARTAGERLVAREGDILKFLEPLLRSSVAALRIRVHGNLHLGHVLYTGKDFVFTDFDGMHELTLAERRRKRSPLRDLASVVRSVHLAAHKLLFDPARVRDADVASARPWASHWTSWVSASFLRAYLDATAGSPLLPTERSHVKVLFDAFAMERELYLLRAHLEEGSKAVVAPLLGIEHILGWSS
jgi:maltose alpha-D-glucosyltransferase/alpha-amylase